MWRNHLFNQGSKKTESRVGVGVGCDKEGGRWGGRTKFEKWGGGGGGGGGGGKKMEGGGGGGLGSLYQLWSDRIARAFNRSGATRAVAIYISKAFVRVWHAGLVHKLKACVRLFSWNFYFSPNDSPLKTMKNVFYFV